MAGEPLVLPKGTGVIGWCRGACLPRSVQSDSVRFPSLARFAAPRTLSASFLDAGSCLQGARDLTCMGSMPSKALLTSCRSSWLLILRLAKGRYDELSSALNSAKRSFPPISSRTTELSMRGDSRHIRDSCSKSTVCARPRFRKDCYGYSEPLEGDSRLIQSPCWRTSLGKPIQYDRSFY